MLGDKSTTKSDKVTIRSVAKRAGVSVATISRVLNNSPLVKESTRQKVLEVLRESGFHQPNRLAKALRTNRTGLVALLVEDILNPYYAILARATDDAAKKLGLMMLLTNDDGNEAVGLERIQVLGSLNVDGILVSPWIGGGRRRALLQQLRASGTPIVGLGDLVEEDEFDVIAIDYLKAAAEACGYLIQLGHRRIGFIGPYGASDRLTGYMKELEKHGLTPFIYRLSATTPTSTMRANMHRALPEFVGSHGLTAIVTHSDLYSLEVSRCLQSLGYKIPDDLSIIGFDDIPQSETALPPLTTISPPYEEMASRALGLIISRIDKKITAPQVKEILPTQLIKRASTAPPAASPRVVAKP